MKAGQLPRKGGVYTLLVEVDGDLTLRVGSLGLIELEKGTYVYVGSAKGPGGLRARVARHLRREKKLRWHIDYLLTAPHARVPWVVYAVTDSVKECDVVSALLRKGAYTPVPGFGSSDCSEGCPAHLLRGVTLEEVLESFRELGLEPVVAPGRQ